MQDQLTRLIGPLSADSRWTKEMRFHQGWWRAFVLAEDPGLHPSDAEKRICSSVLDGERTNSNFLSADVAKAVRLTLEERHHHSRGRIDEVRLFNNLLSSQPLAFNFFGALKLDLPYAEIVVSALFPEATKVYKTTFEFAPEANYLADNSAFDVAFEVESAAGKGLIGLECKYSDDFSPKEYDKPEYRLIFDRSHAFNARYDELITSEFNQLFRNQLMSEAVVLNGEYAFSITGLFCHPDDEGSLGIARRFKSLLNDGDSRFRILTYWDFIECAQRIGPTRQHREFAMMLWARYLGSQLSDRALKVSD